MARRRMGVDWRWACGLVLLVLSQAASAQTAEDLARSTQAGPTVATGLVVTHAEAHRRLPNTVSDVSVGIEVRERTVPDTSGQLARHSQALLDYLRGEHADRLRSEQVAIEPETVQAPGQPVRITGYVGRATVSFRTTPALLPALLSGALDHGANAVQQSGSSPREEDMEATRQDLAAEAARTALTRATVVATALGQHVVGLQRAEVDPGAGVPVRPMMQSMAMAARSPAPIPVEAGEADIAVNVTLTVRTLPGAP